MTKIRTRLSQTLRKTRKDYFHEQPGSLPGTLTIAADATLPQIELIDYKDTDYVHQQVALPEDLIPYLDSESVSWVDVQGLGSEDILQRIGKIFELHPLVLEDIVNVPQRPKVETYDDQLVIITQMVLPLNKVGFHREQVSFVLGKHYLLTVQEEAQYDCFNQVRSRICNNKGILRKHGADYLAYTLIDAIVDGFFPVLEAYGELIEELEQEVVANPTRKTLQKIYHIRRELLALRRAIWPQRDAINSLIRDDSDLISDHVRVYFRDSYDHAVQVMDMVETYRELASGLMDVYLSAVGNRMNEVMKLLTVISSIFIPLTFVAGIYGMNFNTEKSPWNMPELNWYLGYPACLALMGAIAFGLVFFFWRRGWFENFSTVPSNYNKENVVQELKQSQPSHPKQLRR
ncbi:magnesium/cobalt transporter CorA [Synechocystis sp. PCC 7509]|uniref:magnesium/cobalt transporter CorA n=1 Tax=Synechocystis sp. PCC 7509 TaxID=927677 RepID=UPI0002AC658A|nr:magnesium/cobalt transporter CorA [Synechocystis sp. PCC 7509]